MKKTIFSRNGLKRTVLAFTAALCFAGCKEAEMNAPNNKASSLHAASNVALLASGNPLKSYLLMSGIMTTATHKASISAKELFARSL